MTLLYYCYPARDDSRGLPHSKICPTVAPKRSVKRLHCAIFVIVTIVCLTFPGADIEFDFVLMTSAYSQFLEDSCKHAVFSINQKFISYPGLQ